MKTRLQAIRQQHWATRPASERNIILAASAIVLPVLVYLLLWQPAHQELDKLHKALPTLRTQTEQMRLWSKEIEELRHRPKIATLDATSMKTTVEESAIRHQLRESIGSLDAQGANGVRISLPAVPFARWQEWLRSLQQEQHVRVESLAITSLNESGMVAVRATLINGVDQ